MDKKILIIEDDSVMSWVLGKKFKKERFNVIKAKDGEEGLKLAMEERPDVILLDIILPKIDGVTLLKRLRSDSWGKDVPVIILSNLADAKKDIAESNVFDYLVKTDWNVGDVVEKVKKTLGLD